MKEHKSDIKIEDYNYSLDCRKFEKQHGKKVKYIWEDKIYLK